MLNDKSSERTAEGSDTVASDVKPESRRTSVWRWGRFSSDAPDLAEKRDDAETVDPGDGEGELSRDRSSFMDMFAVNVR